MKVAFLGDIAVPFAPTIIGAATLTGHADIAIANIETSIGKNAAPTEKFIHIESNEQALSAIIGSLNIAYANLANNHVMDFGEEGLKHLLRTLRDNGTRYFGAGENRFAAERPEIIEDGGLRIALMGFSWEPIQSVGATDMGGGVAIIPDIELIGDRVREARKSCSHVVTVFHWGYELEAYPLPLHRRIAHEVIDNGASLVIGGHSHVIQGREIYKRAPIYYSLGDFFLPVPGRQRYGWGMVTLLEFAGDAVEEIALFAVESDYSSRTVSVRDGESIGDDIERLSWPLTLDDKEYARFFREHRRRRRGLPIFQGSSLDPLRYRWLALRYKAIELVVKSRLYKGGNARLYQTTR